MYDDLFGDLPVAKKATPATGKKEEAKKKNETKPSSSLSSSSLSIIKVSSGGSSGNDKKDAYKNMITTKEKKLKPKLKSIVQSLGNKGTAVSFVPLALRRKRQSLALNAKRSSLGGGAGGNAISTTAVTKRKIKVEDDIELIDNKKQKQKESIGIQIENKQTQQQRHHQIDKEILPLTVVRSTTTNDYNINQDRNNNIHTHNNKEEDISLIEDLEDENNKVNVDSYIESEELQKLHSSIHPYDMYDPMEPNDYLTYRKNKENEMMRKDLERQAKKTLELQQQLRDHIVEERKKVLESGDFDKIVQSRGGDPLGGGIVDRGGMGRGRGRGRGLSNLPAWLVKKQKEQEHQQRQQQQNETKKQTEKGQFDNSHHDNASNGCTAVLTNMVGPGEVDDELQDEVKEECEMKCGKVLKIRIDEKSGDQVKVFVTFQNKDHARKVPGIFHGRMFGQRQISAKLI